MEPKDKLDQFTPKKHNKSIKKKQKLWDHDQMVNTKKTIFDHQKNGLYERMERFEKRFDKDIDLF